ncbi:MAG TPA: hypothetical protein DDW67_06100 [Elusimicrobia bacterium]|nr:hypothetical protein [Elusimicrobiota bacterium]
MGAVKKLIGDFEKAVLEKLDRKLSEAPPPAPPREAPPVGSLLLKKIEELEGRLASYQERSAFSASQMKAAEEARISGRREIEDLLKVVREQQKFSEMDRQMHEQLQKSWARAEELEKRLMEIYEKAAAPAPVPPAPPPPAPPDMDALASAVSGMIAEKIERAFTALEGRIRAVESGLDTALSRGERGAKAAEERTARLLEDLRSGLREELERNSFSGAAVSKLAAEQAAEASGSAFAAALREESRLNREYSDGALSLIREREDALYKSLSEKMDSLILKTEEQQSALRALASSSEASASSLEAGLARLEGETRSGLAGVRAEISKSAERIEAGSCEALKEAAAGIASTRMASDALSRSRVLLEKISAALGSAAGELDSLRLEGLLGVSGVLVRRHVKALLELTGSLGEQLAEVRKAEGELRGEDGGRRDGCL